MSGGEFSGQQSEVLNRRLFYGSIIDALTPATYARDAHYLTIETPNFGRFTITDYLAFELKQAQGKKAATMHREILETRRACIEISQEQTNTPSDTWSLYVVVHPEDIRSRGMLAAQVRHLTDLAQPAGDDPQVFCLQGGARPASQEISIIDNPLQHPELSEIYRALQS